MSNIIAIIPARSGSKGLKDKNIKNLNGKPLIAYTIEAAVKSGVFKDIIVSTDSREYAKIAQKYGAEVPFLRNEELADDTSSTNDVIEDVIIKLKELGREYDSVMILQPTSPLRGIDDIKNSVKLLEEKNANAVVSMCECEHSPLLSKELCGDKKLDGFLSDLNSTRRQDIKKYYRLNGAIYLLNIHYFFKYKNFYKQNSYAYIMDKVTSIDIDDIYDFKFAEMIIKENEL
ncbi:cytidylyltransferase domain-containing protein [Clostridium ihumii]|uniref:acylneuraminate cytidylyltransferase family protein n=1 Tax=Clostridium ihumii TaxID=1470356 RepID=UPI003D35426C